MKISNKIILTLFLASLPMNVFAVDYFNIEIDNPVQAGSYFHITIKAMNADTSPDTGYTGTVNLTVGPHAGTISPTVTSNFSGNGEWSTSSMQIFAADNNTVITCTDAGGATGMATIDVNPGTATKTIIVLPTQGLTPGLAPGATPDSAPGIYEGTNYYVTVYAVDDYWNIDPTFSGLMDLTNLAGTVTPPSISAVNGAGLFDVRFSFAGSADLIANTPAASSETVNVISLTDVYTHIQVATELTAGVPFPLTLTVSNSETDTTPISSHNGQYDINVNTEGTTNDAAGTLRPISNVAISSGYFSESNFTYDVAERVYFRAEITSATSLVIHPVDKVGIEILPNVPDAIQVTLSPQQVQAQHTSDITVTVLDAYGNPTYSSLRNFDVAFQIVSGGGSLSLTKTATAADGTAATVFTAGIQNERAQVRITVASTAGAVTYVQEDHEVRVSVASAAPGSVVNYPNPFNPAQGQTTSINYYLDEASDVEMRIYDPFGRLVYGKDFKKDDADQIAETATQQGGAELVWDGKNGEGRVVANGIYFVHIVAKTGTKTSEYKRRVGVLK